MKRLSVFLLSGLLLAAVQGRAEDGKALPGLLEEVAAQSNAQVPRRINEDLTDLGYRVEGRTLVNRVGVSSTHAAQMRANPGEVHGQLKRSVCANDGFRRLLDRGADLRYDFFEAGSERQIVSERFRAADCGL